MNKKRLGILETYFGEPLHTEFAARLHALRSSDPHLDSQVLGLAEIEQHPEKARLLAAFTPTCLAEKLAEAVEARGRTTVGELDSLIRAVFMEMLRGFNDRNPMEPDWVRTVHFVGLMVQERIHRMLRACLPTVQHHAYIWYSAREFAGGAALAFLGDVYPRVQCVRARILEHFGSDSGKAAPKDQLPVATSGFGQLIYNGGIGIVLAPQDSMINIFLETPLGEIFVCQVDPLGEAQHGLDPGLERMPVSQLSGMALALWGKAHLPAELKVTMYPQEKRYAPRFAPDGYAAFIVHSAPDGSQLPEAFRARDLPEASHIAQAIYMVLTDLFPEGEQS